MVELTAAVGCCAPLAREPLTGDQAVELARVFHRAHGVSPPPDQKDRERSS